MVGFARPIALVALLAVGLIISFGCGDDDKGIDPNNNPPVIHSVTAEPDSFDARQSTLVTVDATDPDGDDMTCSWEKHGLEMKRIGGTDMSIELQPECDCLEESTTVWIVAIVSDGRGGRATDSVAIRVTPWFPPL